MLFSVNDADNLGMLPHLSFTEIKMSSTRKDCIPSCLQWGLPQSGHNGDSNEGNFSMKIIDRQSLGASQESGSH